MPTYQYKCVNCGDLEFYQSMYESSFIDCPNCHSRNFKKIIQPNAIKFVGSGFYSNDSKK